MQDNLTTQYGVGTDEFCSANRQNEIIYEIIDERNRQIDIGLGGNTNAFDKENNLNDWIAYIVAYAGRAADKCRRNEREGQDFRSNMIKVAALALAAIETFDLNSLDL